MRDSHRHSATRVSSRASSIAVRQSSKSSGDLYGRFELDMADFPDLDIDVDGGGGPVVNDRP
ncbi:hypothetical protein [Streptosporangium canum]|uniref:hypothetical protein n=1 Tax=Streptosporangium canum TaxID=324952 RepID=UPI00378D2239